MTERAVYSLGRAVRTWHGMGLLALTLLSGCAQAASLAGTTASLPALRAPDANPTHPAPTPVIARVPAPMPDAEVESALAQFRRSFAREVPRHLSWTGARAQAWITAARAQIAQSDQTIDRPQFVVVVDRNPRVQSLAILLARPHNAWQVIGGDRVSTGQAGRKDYYITPVGVFAHTDLILDYRAQGTFNENHIRGLGVAGMRVWDFGWQWAIKGWLYDGEGGDIRLSMHATDPEYLEQRLGRPASEGCVRLSDAMNRFLDHHGVLDADYDRAALTDIAYRALLGRDHQPTPLAGRLLVVIDSREPPGTPPTAASRPPESQAAAS